LISFSHSKTRKTDIILKGKCVLSAYASLYNNTLDLCIHPSMHPIFRLYKLVWVWSRSIF